MAAPNDKNTQGQQPPGQLQVIVNTVKGQEYQDMLRKSLKNPQFLDAFTEATAAALRNNPAAFLDCDKVSLYNAILDAARRGIAPDGKQGALTVFNTNVAPRGQKEIWVKKAQFMIMPQGIIDAFAKVGITAYAQSVHSNDQFKFWSDDSGQHVAHTYNPFQDRGERIGAYACGITKGGRVYVEAMGNDELKRARSKSRTPDKGPWVEWPERMEQKSALHRLDKRMPGAGVLGDEDQEPEQVVGVDNRVDSRTSPPIDVPNPGSADVPNTPKALSDESKRPRGLQAIIDSEQPEPEPAMAAEAEVAQQVHSSVEAGEGGSPF
jgi:phage RecT family recombinase